MSFDDLFYFHVKVKSNLTLLNLLPLSLNVINNNNILNIKKNNQPYDLYLLINFEDWDLI